MELSDQEREELMACEFVVVGGGEDEIPAKLIDIDYDIGITIVNRNNTDQYLYCLISKSAMTKEEYGEHYTYWEDHPGLYDEIFELMVTNIRAGEIKRVSYRQILNKYSAQSSYNPSSETCAFNQ